MRVAKNEENVFKSRILLNNILYNSFQIVYIDNKIIYFLKIAFNDIFYCKNYLSCDIRCRIFFEFI